MRSASETLSSALLAILTLMILVSLLVDATPLPAPTSTNGNVDQLHQHTRSRYCGRKLTETLSMLCQGRYPMMGHHRSEYLSDQPQQPVEVEVATLPESGAHGFPYSRSSSSSSAHHHRRVRRAGIYEECCKKSCSFQELRRYCE